MFAEDKVKYVKKAKKKTPKKSNHKHKYEMTEIEYKSTREWFTHQEVCVICGKAGNKVRIDKESKENE